MPSTNTHGATVYSNSKANFASVQPTAAAAAAASRPASPPRQIISAVCARDSCSREAPSARSRPASRTRSSKVAASAAYSTSTPAASVNRNRNSMAAMTWSSTACTWRKMALVSSTVRLGISRTSSVPNCACAAGRWKAVM